MRLSKKSPFKSFLVAWLMFLTLSPVAIAQSLNVSGQVLDTNGQPLAGVGVVEKGTTNGVSSDIDGNFSVRVNSGATLQFTFIGFITKEVTVTSASRLTIILEEDAESLEETVVVGYATQKKASLTGAISSVKSEELITTTTTTTAGALVGKVAGLTSRQSDGRPGANANIQIRNMGEPLFVIDGVACEVGQFNNIDVNDIESITVLKDASASIYGLRASNGVILVTTKMGKPNEKNRISANFYYGFQNFMRYLTVANAAEWYEGRMQEDLNSRGTTARTMEELELWRKGEGKYESFDWQEWITRENSPLRYVQVSMDGGSDRISYHLGVSQNDQQAMIHGFNFKRTNIQSNTEAKVTDNFKVGMRISARIEERHNVGVPGLDDYWQPYYAMFQNWPTQRAFANDNPAYVNKTRNNATGAAVFDKDITGYTDDVWKSVTANAYAEWKPFKGLTARVAYTYWIAQRQDEEFEYTYKVYEYDEENDAYNEIWGNQNPWRRRIRTQREESTFQAQANYDNMFGEHHVSGVIGIEALDRKDDSITFNTLPTNNYIPLTNGIADMQSMSSSISHTRRAGFIFRGAYDWQSRYFVEVSGRYDGSYLYADGNRWGFFPSASAGWRLSEENWFSGAKEAIKMSNLKIRGSWGQTGAEQGVSAYGYLVGYNYGSGNAVLDGETVTGVQHKGVPVTNITWVHSTMINLGLDYGFFNNKLTGSFEVFQRKRTGIPAARYDVLIPTEVGFTLPNENLNSDFHKGWEFDANWGDRKGDFRYNIGFNLTVARAMNGDSYKPRFGSSWNEYRNSSERRWGGINWGYQVDGRFESYEDIQNYPIDNDGKGNSTMLPGDLKFVDVNEDGVINGLDERPIGYNVQNPYVNFGLVTSFGWKGIDVVMNWAGATAQSYYMSWEGAYPFQGDGNSTRYLLTDCWHREDPTDPLSAWVPGTFPATRLAGNNVSFNRKSEFWMHNITYLKLRTLEVGYTLPRKWTQKIKSEGIRFYVNAYNLFSIDNLAKYELDPELSLDSALVTPNLRTVSIGVNLNF